MKYKSFVKLYQTQMLVQGFRYFPPYIMKFTVMCTVFLTRAFISVATFFFGE